MRYLLSFAFVLIGLPVSAGQFDADVLILGEFHDNPHHHMRQAEIVAATQPKALVFEMLTEAQAEAHVPGADAATLEMAFEWADSGWPDFAMYFPIFAAAPEAQVFGAAVPRTAARAAMTNGVVAAFGDRAQTFGLDTPLDADEQNAREALQMSAHCDALPPEMLPAMVDIQRLRDAELARVALRALEVTGGPVVVITGNGHARLDWGMPVYLSHAAPQVSITTLGQGEDGAALQGLFDITETAPGVDRPDPCLAFQ
ncbi:ChaN family lipoprotein [Tateyamaria pelophila]|uniref:ChaN family lipoprotein n=1 Tax=Tateyamaria pelophila TaxID=328415 RepID=UPI001CC07BE1|nr:ChaN family lipoprotein [Tateyamaria pelophila]